MNFLAPELCAFYLHDSSINNVVLEESKTTLYFKDGFFDAEHNQKQNCKIVLYSSLFDPKESLFCYQITITDPIPCDDISLDSFCDMISKDAFVIEVEYYSEFEKALLLIGKIGCKNVTFKITDIEKVEFNYV